ncbi:MAG: DMT family transporter, partial [Ktedonobacteraceae bacterium]|nr:DMT family transporter [Ktedonobacteraceae bacterium]
MPAEKLPAIDTETQDLAIQRIVDEPVQFSAWQRTGITLILILVTLIWGSTFLVVQHTIRLVGPFTFLTIRFGIGALALTLIYPRRLARLRRYELLSGSLLGVILFAAFALQTTGLQYTSTSMAGFITGLYVPFVPLFSIVLLRQWPKTGTTLGIVLSFLGLTLLSVNDHFTLTLGLGELLILGCAVANALHIVSISKFAPRADAINLSIVQIAITALLSLMCMPLAHEPFVLPPLPVWGSGLFMGVLATAFCLAVMNRVQQFVSSVRATLV